MRKNLWLLLFVKLELDKFNLLRYAVKIFFFENGEISILTNGLGFHNRFQRRGLSSKEFSVWFAPEGGVATAG